MNSLPLELQERIYMYAKSNIGTCARAHVYDELFRIPVDDIELYDLFEALTRAPRVHVLYIYDDIVVRTKYASNELVRMRCLQRIDDNLWPLLAQSMSPLNESERAFLRKRFANDADELALLSRLV